MRVLPIIRAQSCRRSKLLRPAGCVEQRSATMPDEIEAVADAIDEIADAIEDADDSDKKDISWKETLELAKVEYMDLLGVSPSFAELMYARSGSNPSLTTLASCR